MILTTQEYKDTILSHHRQMKMKVIVNGRQEIDGHYLKNVVIHEVSNGSDNLTIGSICSHSIKMNLFDSGDIIYDNASVDVFIGLELTDIMEWVPMGRFIIHEVNRENQYEVTLEGFDNTSLLNVDYIPNITYPALLKDVVEDITSQCHLQMKEIDLEDITIDVPLEVTCKEMLSYMASLMGKNARMNRSNQLEFFWYEDSQYIIQLEDQFELGYKKTNQELKITSLTSGSEENTLVSGSGYGITFANPYMTQERLDSLFERLNGFSYTPCTLKWRGDPAIEVGDILYAQETINQNNRLIIMDNTITFDGGMSSSIESKGQNEKEVAMSKSPTEIKLKKLYNTLIESYKNTTETILGHKGGHYIIDTDEDGYPSGWTIMDTPTLRDDTHLWKMSMGGFGFSDDGGKTFKNFAFDLDGNFTANAITTGVLTGEKFELDLENGTILIGERNEEGVIDDPYLKFDDEIFYVKGISEVEGRVHVLESSVDGISQTVSQTQELLVGVPNYLKRLSELDILVSGDLDDPYFETASSYQYEDDQLKLLVVETAVYHFYKEINLTNGFDKEKQYSASIDLYLNTEDKEREAHVGFFAGMEIEEAYITSESQRIVIEDFNLIDFPYFAFAVIDDYCEVIVENIQLVEGSTYQDSTLGLQEISTEINQGYNGVKIVKKEIEKIKNDIENGLGDYVEKSYLEEYIELDGSQIKIGTNNSSFSTVITNGEMAFLDGQNKVASISNKTLKISKAEIDESLSIGKLIFKPRENGNLSLIKLD